jgi:hypothetical protein
MNKWPEGDHLRSLEMEDAWILDIADPNWSIIATSDMPLCRLFLFTPTLLTSNYNCIFDGVAGLGTLSFLACSASVVAGWSRSVLEPVTNELDGGHAL